METVGDFMEDWVKKWKQELSWQERWDVNGWHKEDDMSEELDDYWGQDDEEETDQQPKKHIRRAARNRIIKEAIEKNKVYNIDRLFWNGGKLFGYDTYFKKVIDYDGKERESGPWTSIKDGNKNYEVCFSWDWNCCFLVIVGKTEINTPLGKVPLKVQRQISFDMLFGVKPEIVKVMIEKSIDEIITYIKSKKGKQ